MNNYWEIITWDDESIPIKPQNVDYVKDCIKQKKDIVGTSRTIMKSNIKDFRPTDKVYNEKQLGSGELLEDAARAFEEPMYTKIDNPLGYEETGVQGTYVKRYVQRRKWDSYYSGIPSYKILEESDGQVLMGFILPTHLVTDNVMKCNKDEIKKMA